MNLGFWKQLTKPFVVMAPMADVTDPAFRRIIAKYSRMGHKDGGPHVLWTEFVSADGLCSPGRKILERDLEFSEGERPIVAQLFTSHPEKMFEAAKLVSTLGFDGLDINMGCPVGTIEKQGTGAAHIKDAEQAQKVIRAAQEGVQAGVLEGGRDIPVSVKTRVGYNAVEIDTWIPKILEMNVAALTIHARTRKEMSDVPARWEHVAEVVKIRDAMKLETRIIGNGDITTLEDAHARIATAGADGGMVGRGIFGNPWFFDASSPMRHPLPVTASLSDAATRDYIKTKLLVMLEHTLLFEQLLGDCKNFAIMKKHYKAYVNGWEGAKELRLKLMETSSATEVKTIVESYISGFPQ
jgi:nifR3 family TIM-barrel protein